MRKPSSQGEINKYPSMASFLLAEANRRIFFPPQNINGVS
jgi:hypothetical protein